MNKKNPQIPAQYRQPPSEDDKRHFLEENFELIHYIKDTHVRFWYNNQLEGYATHHHDAMEIILCIDQVYDLTVSGKDYHLSPGEILFIPPHTIHTIHDPSGGARFICLMDISMLNYFASVSTLNPIFMEPYYCTPVTKPKVYQEVYKNINHAIDLYFQNQILSEMDIYAVMLKTFTAMTRDFYTKDELLTNPEESQTSREHYEKIMGLLHYIDENYSEEITLEQAADLTGFSKYHFSRLFKEQTNTTFYEYLIKRRIQEAQILLYTDESITDIAFETGFNNLTTFCRSFKKNTGMSPSDYRLQFRNEKEELSKKRKNNRHKDNLARTKAPLN